MHRLREILTKNINGFFDRKTNLRRGERTKVLLLQTNIFIIISVLLILKPVFTSIMLSHYGVDIMPSAYISIAVSAVIFHAILNQINRNFSLITALGINHTFHIIILTIVSLLLINSMVTPLISIILYIYISLFALITVTYFYQYCQSLLTIRDAKRIYAYIGSGAIAGGVFGGYFTSVMVPYIGNAGLVLVSVIFLAISGVLIFILNKNFTEDTTNSISLRDPDQQTRSSFRAINNVHVFNIAMIIGFGVLVSKLVDYQFNYLAYLYVENDDQLTAFFGFWFSTINVVGLGIQVFLVSKIIDRFGVTKSIAVMPLFLLLGCGLMIVFPILGFAILIKLIDGSLKQSVYKTATEINIMPLHTDLRNRAKTLVDVVVDSVATGLAGIFIYFIINKGDLPFVVVAIVTFCCIAIWLYYVYRSRISYTKELSKMVSGENQNLVESERVGSTAKKFYLDDYLKNNRNKDTDIKEMLLSLTKHEQATVRKAAIMRYIRDYKLRALSDLDHAKYDESISVRKAVYFASLMIAKTSKEVDEIYEDANVVNYVIITAALAEAIGNNNNQKNIYNLKSRVDKSILILNEQTGNPQYNKLLGQIYRTITISKYFYQYPIISEAITNSIDSDLQAEALKSIAYGKAAKLFNDLDVNDISTENLPLFYKVIAVFPKRLISKLNNLKSDKSKELVKYVPAVQFVDDQRHVNFLFSLLDSYNLKIRRVALRTINESRKKHPHLNYNKSKNYRRLKSEVKNLQNIAAAWAKIKLQIKDIEDFEAIHEYNQVLKRLKKHKNRSILNIFIYLALITQNEELRMIYNALKSTRKDAALDFLDGILDYKLRLFVIPTLDLVINKRYTPSDLLDIKKTPLTQRKIISLFRRLKDADIAEHYFNGMRLSEEAKLERV